MGLGSETAYLSLLLRCSLINSPICITIFLLPRETVAVVFYVKRIVRSAEKQWQYDKAHILNGEY